MRSKVDLQKKGDFVVVNFSANSHEMDLTSMYAAVAAGVDAINVDYPRLGVDAVGRPAEAKLADMVKVTHANYANTGLARRRQIHSAVAQSYHIKPRGEDCKRLGAKKDRLAQC